MRIVAMLAAVCIASAAPATAVAQGLHWPLDVSDPAAQECRKKADAANSKIYFDNLLYTDRGACNSLAGAFLMVLMNYNVYSQYVCQQEAKIAREEQAKAREQQMLAGARSSNAGSYGTSGAPASGGAGGSLAETQAVQQPPPAVPTGGGAGGSEATSWGSQPGYSWSASPDPSAIPNGGGAGGSQTESQPQASTAPQSGQAGGGEGTRAAASGTADAQQACNFRNLGDSQLKQLLADPKTRARLTSLLADRPASPKAKAKVRQRTRHESRGRAPTDADFAQPGTGLSPEAADAIGTMIGIGIDAGLSSIGRRGASGTSGAAPRGGSGGRTPHRGTYDGPPR